MHRTCRFEGWIVGLLASIAISSVAHAQSPEVQAVAESLFQEGRALIESGQTAAACRKFEESYRLDEAPGTLLNVAHCHKLEGRVASAWSEFFQVAAEARRDGRDDRERIALESIKELEPRIPKLVIVVPPESRVEGLTIKRNGTEFGRATWGSESPVDPGEILLEAEAPGFKKWAQKVSLAEAEHKQISVPPLVALPKPKEPPPPTTTEQPQPSGVAIDRGSPTSQTFGLVLGGIGLVGIGVGSYFGVRAISKRADSEDKCSLGPAGNGCPSDAVKLNQDAKDAARIANLGIGIGVVAVVAGTFLYLDGAPDEPTESAKAPAVDVGVGALPGGAFATVQGGW